MKTLIILSVLMLPGCALFGDEIDQIAGKIGSGVDRYCAELNEVSRAEIRKSVNPTPGGATIIVTCP